MDILVHHLSAPKAYSHDFFAPEDRGETDSGQSRSSSSKAGIVTGKISGKRFNQWLPPALPNSSIVLRPSAYR